MKYVQRLKNAAKSVWSLDFLIVLLYEFVFIALVINIGQVFTRSIYREMIKLTNVGLSISTPTEVSLTKAALVTFWTNSIINIVLALLIFYFIWVLFRGLVWMRLLHQKWSKKMYKLPIVSLIFLIIAIAVMYVISVAIVPTYAPMFLVIIFLIILHFGWINSYAYMKYHTINKSIRKTFSLGVKKIPQLIIPYLIIGVLLSILLRIPMPETTVGISIWAVLIIGFLFAFSKTFLRHFVTD